MATTSRCCPTAIEHHHFVQDFGEAFREPFAEASELFMSGVDFLEIYDDEHSDHEDRFIAVGPISKGVVVIVWTERDAETVRIISARKATKREAQLFREHMGEKS